MKSETIRIRHESGHEENVTPDFFEKLDPTIKKFYKVVSQKSIPLPAEIAGKKAEPATPEKE